MFTNIILQEKRSHTVPENQFPIYAITDGKLCDPNCPLGWVSNTYTAGEKFCVIDDPERPLDWDPLDEEVGSFLCSPTCKEYFIKYNSRNPLQHDEYPQLKVTGKHYMIVVQLLNLLVPTFIPVDVIAVHRSTQKWSCINSLNWMLSYFGMNEDAEEIPDLSLRKIADFVEDLSDNDELLHDLEGALDNDRQAGEWENILP